MCQQDLVAAVDERDHHRVDARVGGVPAGGADHGAFRRVAGKGRGADPAETMGLAPIQELAGKTGLSGDLWRDEIEKHTQANGFRVGHGRFWRGGHAARCVKGFGENVIARLGIKEALDLRAFPADPKAILLKKKKAGQGLRTPIWLRMAPVSAAASVLANRARIHCQR